MADHAHSTNASVQAQLDRLWSLSPGTDILGLERITALLDRLGNPENALPPVFHVAGTNGKGSTCAFLRAAIEAAGLTCHVYTSPHLVRFNERIRLAGTLIDDDALAALLDEVLDVAGDIGASFFEVTTAAAFLAFARTPADACIIEVGLGGRLDATNVIARPAVTGIAQLGIDHQSFLGDTLGEIAGEKAGIAKHHVPLVCLDYDPTIAAVIERVAASAGAEVRQAGRDWRFHVEHEHLHVTDEHGEVSVPLPIMRGTHQHENLALAIAMLRAQDEVAVPLAALEAAPLAARWPARMQRLADGPLTRLLPPGGALWLDGGHNEAAGLAIATEVATWPERPHLVLGILANKDPAALLAPFAGLVASLYAVPVPAHECHTPEALASLARQLGIPAATSSDPRDALAQIAAEAPDASSVLILGSLYLAGEVLADNDEMPT